jgi:adenosylmethionine-8-amino-7-oxononanoate aminotransferase
VRQPDGTPFPWQQRSGAKICMAARRHGLLTRPILDTLVFMPPLCTTTDQIDEGLQALHAAIAETLG